MNGCTTCTQARDYPAGYNLAPEFRGLSAISMGDPGFRTVMYGLSAVSAAACGYHGYKRNRGSIGWTIGWVLLGSALPLIAPAIGLAQGWAKPAR
jgi:hypothetical protein